MPRRKDHYWKTTFGRWVSTYGVRPLLDDLARAGEPINQNTVYHWLSGRQYVRTSIAFKIVDLSGGKLSIGDVLSHPRELSAVSASPVDLPRVKR